MSVMSLARAERGDLRDLLSGLTQDQWQAPSLCAGWSVHDVVAHLLSDEELSGRQLAERFARGRFTVDRANAIGLAEYSTRTPADVSAA